MSNKDILAARFKRRTLEFPAPHWGVVTISALTVGEEAKMREMLSSLASDNSALTRAQRIARVEDINAHMLAHCLRDEKTDAQLYEPEQIKNIATTTSGEQGENIEALMAIADAAFDFNGFQLKEKPDGKIETAQDVEVKNS